MVNLYIHHCFAGSLSFIQFISITLKKTLSSLSQWWMSKAFKMLCWTNTLLVALQKRTPVLTSACPTLRLYGPLCFFSQFYILAKHYPKFLFLELIQFVDLLKWSVALFPMLGSNSEESSKVLGLQTSAHMPGQFLKLSNRGKWVQFSTMSDALGT